MRVRQTQGKSGGTLTRQSGVTKGKAVKPRQMQPIKAARLPREYPAPPPTGDV